MHTRRRAHLWAVACGLAAGVACGGKAVIDGPRGGGGSGAGSGGTKAATTSTSATSSGAGGGPCDPADPTSCPSDSYCHLPEGADCSSTEGVCQPRPEACDADCPGVCGCDGELYCNVCSAHGKGVDVSPDDLSCTSGDTSHAAKAFPGGLDHIFIAQRDDTEDLCLRLMLDAPTMGTFSVTAPDPWGVNVVSAHQGTEGCLDFIEPPPPAQSASMASGSIDFVPVSGLYPCELDLAVVATFDDPPPWLPPSIAAKAADVPVEGVDCP